MDRDSDNFDDNITKFPWELRTRPEVFDPIQLEGNLPVSWIDWWSTRSNLCGCLFPLLRCIAGNSLIDGDDISVWKEQLENTSNAKCPDSMKGVWWLQYNQAHENLVTIFSDAEFIGDYNEEQEWKRMGKANYSRDNSIFGYILAVAASIRGTEIDGRMNLKDGVLTVRGKGGNEKQVVYRVNDDEWWKIHYVGDIGEEGEQDVEYMYKWLKVLDKDCKPTEHWETYKAWSNDPLPHGGKQAPCTPFICGLTNKEKQENMVRPNPKQIIMLRK